MMPKVGSPLGSMPSKHHRRTSGKGQEVGEKRKAKHTVTWLAFFIIASVMIAGFHGEHL